MGKNQHRPMIGEVTADKLVAAESISELMIKVSPSSLAEARLRPGVPSVPEHYVPREAMMKELADKLGDGDRATVTGRAVASGDGGHGKTVLALAYAREFKDRYPGGCYAVECEAESLVTALASLVLAKESASEAELAGSDQDKARYVQVMLSQEKRCLLILDNVRDAKQWSEGEFQKLLPSPPCHILVTTRAEHLPGTREVSVGKLTEDEAVALLAKFRLSATQAANREAITAILGEVEYLAAVVAAVGVLMRLDEDDDWAAYAERLREAPVSELPDKLDAVRAETGYAGKTAQVLDDLRDRLWAAEVRVLDYAALLPADKIVPLWLEMLLAADAEKDGDARLDLGTKPSGKARTPADVIVHLKKLGLLVTAAGDDVLLSVHRLHRRRANEVLEQQAERRAILLDAVAAMAEKRGKAASATVTKPDFRLELIQLPALATALAAEGDWRAARSVAIHSSEALNDLGYYSQVRNLMECLVTHCTSDETFTRWERGLILNDLAVAYVGLGQLPEARRFAERALENERNAGVPRALALAIRMNNLSAIVRAMGDLREARRLAERCVELFKECAAPDSRRMADGYNTLAVVLQDLGERNEACRLMKKAVQILEGLPDANRFKLANRYANLATMLSSSENRDEALHVGKLAIELADSLRDRVHEAETAQVYLLVVSVFRYFGNLREARRLARQAIETAERSVEPNHKTLLGLRNQLKKVERALRR